MPQPRIKDYITPVTKILEDNRSDQKKRLTKLLSPQLELIRKLLYRNGNLRYYLKKLSEDDWLKKVRKFRAEDVHTYASQVYARATKLLGSIPAPEIILFPGFGACNGRVIMLGGKPKIVASPDFGYFDGNNLKCLIAHEYGHFLRSRVLGIVQENQRLYSRLFEEGWAIYLSQLIFPRIPSGTIYMSKLHGSIGLADPPGGYLNWCHKNEKTLIKLIMPVLGSNSRQERIRFFDCGRLKGPKTPIRTGYYLGAELIRRLSRDFSLKDILYSPISIEKVRKWLGSCFPDNR